MHELHELKEKLLDELKRYGKGDLSAGSLDIIDKLAHATKNLCKVIDDDEGYSGYYPMSYRHHDSTGRYSSNRYYRDGYPRDGGMVEELRTLMRDAPDDRTRQEFQRFISKIESM